MDFTGQYTDTFNLWKDIVQIRMDSFFSKLDLSNHQDITQWLTDINAEMTDYIKDVLPDLKNNYNAIFFNLLKNLEQSKHFEQNQEKRKLSLSYDSRAATIQIQVGIVNSDRQIQTAISYNQETDSLTINSSVVLSNTYITSISVNPKDPSIENVVCSRSTSDDVEPTAYCWINNTTRYYTSSKYPCIGDTVYTSVERDTIFGTISNIVA